MAVSIIAWSNCSFKQTKKKNKNKTWGWRIGVKFKKKCRRRNWQLELKTSIKTQKKNYETSKKKATTRRPDKTGQKTRPSHLENDHMKPGEKTQNRTWTQT